MKGKRIQMEDDEKDAVVMNAQDSHNILRVRGRFCKRPKDGQNFFGPHFLRKVQWKNYPIDPPGDQKIVLKIRDGPKHFWRSHCKITVQ